MRHAYFFCILLFTLTSINAFASAERESDHQALRDILKKAAEAMNSRNLELLKPLISDKYFSIVTVDSRKFDSLEAFETYWNNHFEGDNAVLKRVEVAPKVDKKTAFFGQDTGIAEGVSDETYYFTDGDVRSMQTRWSAIVHREDGNWKLANVHFTANVLDNPILDFAKQAALRNTLIAALIGLIVGFLLMGIAQRKKSA